MAQFPVVPMMIMVHSVRGTTGVVTTECSVQVLTMKVIFWPPKFISTVGSRGPNITAQSLSVWIYIG